MTANVKNTVKYITAALQEYADVLQMPGMTIDDLIRSHNHLRSQNLERNQEWLAMLDDARKKAYADERARAKLECNISLLELAQLSVGDLAQRIVDAQENT